MDRMSRLLFPISIPVMSLWDPRGWLSSVFNLAWAVLWICLTVYCVREALAWPLR